MYSFLCSPVLHQKLWKGFTHVIEQHPRVTIAITPSIVSTLGSPPGAVIDIQVKKKEPCCSFPCHQMFPTMGPAFSFCPQSPVPVAQLPNYPAVSQNHYDILPIFANAAYYPNWRVYKEQPPSSLRLGFISHVFYAFAWYH